MNQNNLIHVLLVEDDASLGFVIKDNLEQEHMLVNLCTDGEAAWETFKTNTFDICILDVMLPKLDGFTLAGLIREKDKEVPLIFLTAKSMKDDKINGFKLGADDYMVKPFNIEELILRMQVFLKRTGKREYLDTYNIGKYLFDFNNLELVHDEKARKLTRKEALLLKQFCEHKNEMIQRETLLKHVWDTDDYFAGRSMDVFISKLRKYFTDDPNIEISNHHGVGFKLEVKNS